MFKCYIVINVTAEVTINRVLKGELVRVIRGSQWWSNLSFVIFSGRACIRASLKYEEG